MNAKSVELDALPLQPTIFIIFGITGDLASRKLLPALLGLYTKKMLPKRFAIIGITRRTFSREEFRESIRSHMHIKQGVFKEEDIKHFLDHFSYEQGMFDDPLLYKNLGASIKNIDDRWGQCSNKLFHLSVPPNLYEGILTNVADSALNKPCDDGTGWTRILIEKPFGNDAHTAQSLDKLLGKLFDEEQIFRIDHYLAKESLQNITAFRFANAMFEPLWHRQYIDKVHIKLFEKVSVESRGQFYDNVGALKDVGQNHLLAMLALIAMDEPKSFEVDAIRKERARVLNSLVPITARSLDKFVVRGQYEGYTTEPGVLADSTTETYFRIESRIKSPRWKGVPFYMESGKAFADARTEIDIYFKASSCKMQNARAFHGEDPKCIEKQNVLTFRIQPDEGIKVRFFVKTPGYSMATEPKMLKFRYADTLAHPDALGDYERLIHDAFVGDQTLFASTDEIMASWKYVMPILDKWGELPLKMYKKGVQEIE
ncbi:MAG TPA: glucose-6-phosphate dehydrogenase [Candidatus Paceibacterota bacterium]|jgi:glucose-6-phosphate 1-dehydrogenase|nr:glucose-6-phosphate dehydrogenase [Candidatus Paceibacterota bacterium]